ncbi:hypothetical protein BY996DRAFT_7065794 [Phakopsora pachyrhizi]|nr:hypothetical protein BY996DRAFT_7065794 [Phakopsora pachyrhizi]
MRRSIKDKNTKKLQQHQKPGDLENLKQEKRLYPADRKGKRVIDEMMDKDGDDDASGYEEVGEDDDLSSSSSKTSSNNTNAGVDLKYILKELEQKVKRKMVKKQRIIMKQIHDQSSLVEKNYDQMVQRQRSELENVVSNFLDLKKVRLEASIERLNSEIISSQSSLKEILECLSKDLRMEIDLVESQDEESVEQLNTLIEHEKTLSLDQSI